MVANGFSAAKADPVLYKIVLFIECELKWHIQNRCLHILVETWRIHSPSKRSLVPRHCFHDEAWKTAPSQWTPPCNCFLKQSNLPWHHRRVTGPLLQKMSASRTQGEHRGKHRQERQRPAGPHGARASLPPKPALLHDTHDITLVSATWTKFFTTGGYLFHIFGSHVPGQITVLNHGILGWFPHNHHHLGWPTGGEWSL